MPDRVEDILKRIHTMFAKCEAYHDSPDKVIISKSETFEILEELNEAIYEVLDNYEATTRSKERARLEMDKKAAEIVAEAKRNADEVNAASLMYTDTMLEELRTVIENTGKSLRHEYIEILAEMDKRIEGLNVNKDEVKQQLSELHDSERYLNVLHDMRLEAEKKKEKTRFDSTAEAEEEEEPEEEAPKKASVVIRVNKPGENPGVTIAGRSGKRNKDEKRKQLEAMKINTGDEDIPAELPYGTTYQAEDFNLDAEYLQWKEGEEGKAAEEPPKESKKGLFGLFGRK